MARDPLTAARARVKALEANHTRAVTAAGKAHDALARVTSRLSSATGSYAAAQDRYRDTPTTANAKAIRKAAEVVELRRLECDRPRAAAQSADEAVQVAVRALAECMEEIRRLEHEQHLAECRKVASPAGFRDRTADHWARLFTLLEECEQVTKAIDAEYSKSVEAAVEAGVDPLGGHHWVLPILERVAEELPGCLEYLDHTERLVGTCAEFELRPNHRRPTALTIASVLRGVRGVAFSAAPGHALLRVNERRFEMLRARLAVMAEIADRSEAVRTGHAIQMEPDPEPPRQPPALAVEPRGGAAGSSWIGT